MSYRRRRRYYRRPAAPVKQEPDGCLVGLFIVPMTWALCLLAIGIAIATHGNWGLALAFLAVSVCLLVVISAKVFR